MPELPEVETVKNDLSHRIIGRKIREIEIHQGRVFRNVPSRASFERSLLGKKIVGLQRRGKALLFSFNTSVILVIRLGMTGQVIVRPEQGGMPDKHTHLVLTLEGGARLFFRDVRRFGQVFLIPLRKVESFLQMGPEPLHDGFLLSHLQQILNSSMRIKTLLMDQRKVAGIGNIYSDEILFAARINPLRAARSLSSHEMKRLYQAIREVLREGVRKRGSTIRDFRDGLGKPGKYQCSFRVYQRRGHACMICETPIERIKLGGRNSHFCPCCQH